MTFEKNRSEDIAVIGAGPVGMLAALGLAQNGYSVSLIGPSTCASELRTTALMLPAVHMIQDLHIWNNIKCHAAALSSIRIIDVTSRLVRSPTVNFHSAEIGKEAFGYNIPNAILNNALSDSIAHTSNIVRLFSPAKYFDHQKNYTTITLEDNSVINASLIVAADGRLSPTRAAARINIKQWNYPQTALVLNFSHDLPHNNISTEFHTEYGPFTQVPLPGNKSSLVWVINSSRTNELLNMESKEIAKLMEDQMQLILGKITVETPVQAWPLLGMIPDRFAANRTILVGEAAHVLPPIGAQGLNLGFRDVQTLINILPKTVANFNSKVITAHYNQRRKSDILIRSRCVHALNYALLSNILPVHILRNFGFELLRNCSPLRNLFMREGMHPGDGLKEIVQKFTIK